MTTLRLRTTLIFSVAVAAACASAEDRLNEGIALQSQGRYIQAVYRYAEAIEKDQELAPARDRMRAAGDSAVMVAMDDADQLERRGDPVQAATRYVEIDRMLARVRQVGERIDVPSDYGTIRRGLFDAAIDWQMIEGDRSAEEGRWEDARGYYASARSNYLPSRDQVEESYEAETNLLLRWSEVSLEDHLYRSSYDLAEDALGVRTSPARATVLAVRDLQARALEAGTVVLAVVPVTADPAVREWLGGEFEVQLDSDLGLDHWTRPPPFITMADPLVLRSELRGLLRGQAVQSPLLVGRALDLIGADLGVMIRVSGIEVVEEDLRRNTRTAVVQRNRHPRGGRTGPTAAADTVQYTTVRGTMAYYVESEILLVDPSGREVNRFTASSRQRGPFERGEFDGDPRILRLQDDERRFFDPAVFASQMTAIEVAVLEELAAAVAVGTYDQVLAGIR